MLRILGLVVLLVAGCGVRQGTSGQAPPGSVQQWTERMRQADSLRFDVEFSAEGDHRSWWRRKGEMSPLSYGGHQQGQPKPVRRMVEQTKSMRSGTVFESQVIERFSREFYLQDDIHVTMPPGKRWVKLDIAANASWVSNAERGASLTFNALHPDRVFVDLDPRTLVVSPGSADQVDGVPAWRYELTAAANVESNPNTARKKPVEATVWVNHDGLPVKVEQRSTGEDGNKNTKVTKYSDWDATPPVEIPPAAEIAGADAATWTDRW